MAASPPREPFLVPGARKSLSRQPSESLPPSKKPRLSHPLRQTSFPASEAAPYIHAGPQSARSETGSVAASTFSSTSASTSKPRGRGRPRKNPTISTSVDDHNNATDSQLSAREPGTSRSVISANNNIVAGDNDGEDADEDEDLTHHHLDTDADKAADLAEKLRQDRLKDILTTDQSLRFEKWRAISFPKNSIRKLVNQIVSQSVTETPIQAVRVYAKWFVAEIVERAREVQEQWAEAYEQSRAEERRERKQRLDLLEQKLRAESEKPENERMSEYDRRRLAAQIERVRRDAEAYVPNPHRGGLMPDHVREALRRYKSEGDGGGVGFEGLSHPLLGVHGSKTWGLGEGAGATRLFR